MAKPATSAARLAKLLSCSARSSTKRRFDSAYRSHSKNALLSTRCSMSSALHFLTSCLQLQQPKVARLITLKCNP